MTKTDSTPNAISSRIIGGVAPVFGLSILVWNRFPILFYKHTSTLVWSFRFLQWESPWKAFTLCRTDKTRTWFMLCVELLRLRGSQKRFISKTLKLITWVFFSRSVNVNTLQFVPKYRLKSVISKINFNFIMFKVAGVAWQKLSRQNLSRFPLMIGNSQSVLRELRIALTRIRKTIGIRRLIPHSSINNEGGRGRPSTPKTEAPYPPIHYFENANISLRVDLPSTRFPEWKLYFWKVNANLACITHRVRYQFPAQLRKGEYGWMDENADVTAEPRYHFSRAFCVFNIRWRVDQGDLTLVCASCPGDMQHAGIG